jgi:hypothetical protein
MKYTPLVAAIMASVSARHHLSQVSHHFNDRYKRENTHEAMLRNLSNAMPRQSNVWTDYQSRRPKYNESTHEKLIADEASVKQHYVSRSTVPAAYKALKQHKINESRHENVIKDQASVKQKYLRSTEAKNYKALKTPGNETRHEKIIKVQASNKQNPLKTLKPKNYQAKFPRRQPVMADGKKHALGHAHGKKTKRLLAQATTAATAKVDEQVDQDDQEYDEIENMVSENDEDQDQEEEALVQINDGDNGDDDEDDDDEE